ncbi:tyrosine-type recombinase/integrase [Actinokineospora inagensis]|uniref:tyrosine-type recombinase/integrase n=1 Tax=Actinokineospora inagensis TaxID=103730 RepID=UPI001FDF2713|nr:site-specific integrase [Actinokineospora inagensis]
MGTFGKVYTKKWRDQYRARCRYRHYDGKIYEVERYGSTTTKAEERLKLAIRDFMAPAKGNQFSAQSKFSALAAGWMAELERLAERGIGSWGTIDTYRSRLQTVVLPTLGELRAHELTVMGLNAVVQDVRDKSTASSAKTVRAIVSGICGFAVTHGALERNLARDIGRIDSRQARHRPSQSRALTEVELLDLLGKLDVDEQALRDDLPDLVRFFLATGERTGEALAAHWEQFNPVGKVIQVHANVIRATGRGKILNEGKTANSVRPIALTDWCVAMLVQRQAVTGATTGPIFPSSTGTIREASNVRNRAWKPFLNRAGYQWVTFRTFRRTVATLLDDAGLTARQIADVLGHARPSMTQDVYMARGAVSRAAAEALGNVRGFCGDGS